MAELTSERRARIEHWAREPIAAVAVASRGYTPAARFLVTFASGKSAFVKIGTTPLTVEALRREASVYRTLSAPFMPECLGFEDHASEPLLVLEDLRAAHWPPPWDDALIAEVQRTLAAVHASRAPLPRFEDLHSGLVDGWQQVQNEREPFLSLGLASAAWLERALPVLVTASAALRRDGDEVVHLDVRSDNLCRAPRGVVLIDWNNACIGNGEIDTGFLLPSLESEGGPRPEAVLPRSPEVAAFVSGFFAARAGLPRIPDAPRVRIVQLEQLAPALRWAVRAFGLPPLDGAG